MPKIRDKTIVHWIENGIEFDEELIVYDDSSDESVNEEIQEEIDISSDIGEKVEMVGISYEVELIGAVLNDLLEKFSILKCIAQKGLEPCTFKFPEYKTIEERFGDKIDYGTEFYSESKKRFMDLTTIYSILYRTLEDLLNNGNFGSLNDGLRIMRRLMVDEQRLFQDELISRDLEEDQQRRVQTEGKELEAAYKNKLEELRKLEVIYEDAIAYGTLEYKYLDNWEAARRHQGQFVLDNIENNYLDIINASNIKIQFETRIHGDIVNFLDENLEDMNTDIGYWMYRYDQEVESRDSELLKLKMDRESQMLKFATLKTTYEEHQEFIEYWSGVLEERRQAKLRFELETDAATKIQSWWRGVMVRKHLGPYRRKKKKGKGKDKGKDKGKKKKK